MNNKNYSERKILRLQNFDYSQNGAYFITICTRDRKQYLCKIVGDDAHIVPQIKLTNYGYIVEKYIKNVPGIDKYVIMPNHIHMIIKVKNNGTMWASSPTTAIPQIIKSFKSLVTKQIGFSIWQRSYYDHIIRGEKDYLEIWEYIENNPQKWQLDCYYN